IPPPLPRPPLFPYTTLFRSYFWIIPRQRSRWAEYLENDPRVSLVVEQPNTLAKVRCRGHAELVERPNIGGQWVPIATRMSVRYRSEEHTSELQSRFDLVCRL